MMRSMSTAAPRARLESCLEAFPRQRIAVIGDLALDEFVHGRTARVSREAPVLILRHESTDRLPGCAGNAARNVAALGGAAFAVGLLGEDEGGTTLAELLRDCGVDTAGVVRLPQGRTWRKTRFTAGDLHTVQQQVMRLDHEPEYGSPDLWRGALLAAVEAALQRATGILLCDYGGGVLDASTRPLVLELCRRRGVPVLADSRYALDSFAGVTCATPNETEIEPILGRALANDADVEAAGLELQRRLRCPALVITRGRLGMTVFDGTAPLHLPAYGDEAVDVAGAGDTVAAAVVLALAAGSSVGDAARLANYAASRVVRQRGTAVTERSGVLVCLRHDAALR